MPTEELEARYEKADDAVGEAMEARDDAIHELIEAQVAVDDALDAWAPLYDELKARDPSRVTEAAWKRRKMN
jgi:hypothetical protein